MYGNVESEESDATLTAARARGGRARLHLSLGTYHLNSADVFQSLCANFVDCCMITQVAYEWWIHSSENEQANLDVQEKAVCKLRLL